MKDEGRGMKDEMGPRRGQDLRDRTFQFALGIVRACGELPRTTAAQVLGRQVLRSGTSVGANYREAGRARSRAEFVSKLGDCLKELDETTYWLELLEASGTAPGIDLSALRDECEQLLAMFTTAAKKAKVNTARPEGRE